MLWDFAGQPICDEIMDDLRSLQARFRRGEQEIKLIENLLAADEVRAMHRRLDRLIASGRYPDPGGGRNVPWPPV